MRNGFPCGASFSVVACGRLGWGESGKVSVLDGLQGQFYIVEWFAGWCWSVIDTTIRWLGSFVTNATWHLCSTDEQRVVAGV